MAATVTITTEEEAKELQKKLEQTEEAINDFYDELDEEETITPGAVSEQEMPTNVKQAKNWLNSFMDFIKSNDFKESVKDASEQYKVPPKKIAEGFFSNILGTIGDVLGVTINTIGNAAHTVINVLSNILHGGVELITKVTGALARVVTLNTTAANIVR